MGDLDHDTALSGGDGRYRATLSADWEIWGPNGGYLAAVALRAAGTHSGLARPASLLCHFLDVAAFDEVTIDTVTLRRSRRAESTRVSMTQDGRNVLEAMVWSVAGDIDGLVHDAAPAPDVPGPDGLPSVEERLGPDGGRFAFFANLDERPIAWVDDWEHRDAGEPLHQCWYRFRPRAVFDDPWVDAGRLAVLVDTFQWPAAVRAHAGGSLAHIAPSLDLACRFHRLAHPADGDWLLVEARSPVADDGLVGGTSQVWDRAGRLLASGGQQMLSRPAPPGMV
ncbi:MAG TPA: thioesterase family protein [Acidimicrobiales bacterium]|nr:thioesterase family protein [Acidimicrobiales bacterium]